MLAVAGLLLRSFFAQQAIDPGLVPEGLLTLELELPASQYNRENGSQFMDQLLTRVRGLTGVKAAGISTDTPLASGYSARGLRVEDALSKDPDASTRIYWHSITPGYFETLGTSLLALRSFGESDTATSPGVVIVSQEMAHRSWAGENPLGKRVTFDRENWLTVVGIVANVRHRSFVEQPLEFPDDPDVYFAFKQMPRRGLSLAIRSEGNPESLLEPIRRTVLEIDPSLPVFNQSTMQQILSDQLITARATSQLITLFGFLALFLAAIGISGMLANLVTERRTEIGIRMALGAHPREVLSLVMKQGLWMALWGTGIGVAASVAVTRLIESLLYQTSPADPTILGLVTLLLIGVALIATYIPARRAVRIDPIKTLRAS